MGNPGTDCLIAWEVAGEKVRQKPSLPNPNGGEKWMKALAKMVRRLEAKSVPYDSQKYNAGRGFDFSGQAELLSLALQVAVPLWVDKLKKLDEVLPAAEFADELSRRAKRCADVVADTGDALMFKTKGKSSAAFNALAEGIACLAFCLGGITAFGTHWEYIQRARVDS